MSYILDALKKSEQERSRGRTPDLKTLHAIPAEATRPRRGWWPYALTAVLLFNAGALLIWLRPWEAGTKPPSTPGNTPSMTTAAPARPVILPPVTPPAPLPAIQPAPAPVAAAPQPGLPPAVAAAQPERPAAKESSIVNFSDLPPDTRRNIPEMSFSVHLYSAKPAERMVSINGKMMKEGQEVIPGLRLEEITKDGMVFSYQGVRFKRGVF